ncbi:Alcohol dehydrogenase C-terminal [Trinorchestia longiramus]|nr:Alcohol dehydrogenase C-terminal [Trinorchestia longiramus]
MRAIQVKEFGASSVLSLVADVEKPTIKDNEVLVHVQYSGVNPVDTYMRSGAYPLLPQLPYTPGKDGAGVVAQVGVKVQKFKVGDRVFVIQSGRYGTLAEFTPVPEQHTYPLPENLSFSEGAALGVAPFTAYRALYVNGRAKAGQRVLVHGASGSVGQNAVQLAVAGGMRVVGTAGSSQGQDIVKQCGAAAVYNHNNQGYIDDMKKNEEDGFDIIIEMLSNVNLGNDLSLLRKKGTVVVVGCRGETTINPRLLMAPETSIVGCSLFAASEEEWKLMAEAVIDAVKNGVVKPRISRVYTLDQVSQAHDDVINQSTGGKLVVDISV